MINKKQRLIELTRKAIKSIEFIKRHKSKLKDFTRQRMFNFALAFNLLLQKSVKSLQLVLNELWIEAHIKNTVTSSAYSQVRKKFKHTAFIELNEKAIALYYSDNKIKRWKGYRVVDIQRSEFKVLYFFRWGAEGFYYLLKGRLNLENFTGKSLESVKQDFWSSIYISNVETIFTQDTYERRLYSNVIKSLFRKYF
jgi:hypothetical protein